MTEPREEYRTVQHQEDGDPPADQVPLTPEMQDAIAFIRLITGVYRIEVVFQKHQPKYLNLIASFEFPKK